MSVENYDVIDNLKADRDTFAYKIRTCDSYIERHKHKESKNHIDKMEAERDYCADARDMLEIAIDILTEKMGE